MAKRYSLSDLSPGMTTLMPASLFIQSGQALKETLSLIMSRCASNGLSNTTAQRELAALEKETIEVSALVHERLNDIIVPLPPLDIASAIELANSSSAAPFFNDFSTSLTRLDREINEHIIPSFNANVDQAVKLDRLFSQDASDITIRLKEDHDELEVLFSRIRAACLEFSSKWTPIRNAAGQHGTANGQSYAKVLYDAFAHEQFLMDPHFPRGQMDELSITDYSSDLTDLGRKWVNKLVPTPSAAKLRDVETIIQKTLQHLGPSPGLNEFNDPSITGLWEDSIASAKENSRSDCFRVCVIGSMSHGKSSLINALAGRIILEARQMSVTAWPLVVRHVPGRRDTTLTINQEHFQPFLDKLREKQLSTTKGAHNRVLSGLPQSTRRNLKLFEAPFTFASQITDKTLMIEAMNRLNDLMRCCWYLLKESDIPPLANLQWPCLEIEFEAFGHDTKIEIIDLPGKGADEKQIPSHILEELYRGAVDGAIYICVPKYTSQMASAATTNQVRDILGPVLASYSTHKDESDEITVENTTLQLSVEFWGASTQKTRARVHPCSPGMYVSSKGTLAVSYQKVDGVDKRRCLTDIWNSVTCTTALIYLVKDKSMEGEASFALFDDKSWSKKLQMMIDTSHHPKMIEHFNEMVLADGIDRRQLKVLRDARRKFRNLHIRQEDLIRRALDAREGTDGLQIKYKDFQARGFKAINQWMETGKLQVDTMSKTVDDEVNHLLEEAIAEVIRDFKFIFSGYSKNRQGKSVELSDAAEAFDLQTKLGRKIQELLTKSQLDFVYKMRKAAREAWEARFQRLNNLLGDEVSATLPLQQEVMAALQSDAIDIDLAVREDTTMNILSDTSDVPPAVAEEEFKNTVAKTWLPHSKAQADFLGTGNNLNLSDAEKIVIDALNKFGYVFRPPISGSITGNHPADDEAFSIFKGDFPLTIPTEEIITAYKRLVISPWIDVVRVDTRNTLVETVRNTSAIAQKRVTGIIEGRLKALVAPDLKTPPLDIALIEQLIVGRAKCCAMYGVLDELCQQWEDLLKLIVSGMPDYTEVNEEEPNDTNEDSADDEFDGDGM